MDVLSMVAAIEDVCEVLVELRRGVVEFHRFSSPWSSEPCNLFTVREQTTASTMTPSPSNARCTRHPVKLVRFKERVS
jgi:hypothetical protein